MSRKKQVVEPSNFELLSKKGKLMMYSTPKNINSPFIIECIYKIAIKAKRPTVLVLDNTPWRKSAVILAKQKEWTEKDVHLFFLPI